MKIGRFFSLQTGRVGQYLSPRVLLVRTPFQKNPRSGQMGDLCYFGFDRFNQMQKFVRYLSGLGYHYQIHQAEMLPQYPYEVKLQGHPELARELAYWDRADQQPVQPDRTPVPLVPKKVKIAA